MWNAKIINNYNNLIHDPWNGKLLFGQNNQNTLGEGVERVKKRKNDNIGVHHRF